MKDEKLRKVIDKFVDDHFDEEEQRESPTLLFVDHAYDKSILGVTEDGHVVYALDKMIEEFAEDESCSIDEAMEWVEYNTLRALPYAQGKKPIIVNGVDELLLVYGD